MYLFFAMFEKFVLLKSKQAYLGTGEKTAVLETGGKGFKKGVIFYYI